MPRKGDTYVPDIPDLIRRTAKLRRDLIALVRRFPEDHLELADRIFVRLLNPMWRNPIGGIHAPFEQKQAEAIHWIDQLLEYLRDLEGCISGVMLRPKLFRALPLHSYLQLSAAECIRRLLLQEAALKRIQSAPPQSSPVVDSQDDLCTRLGVAVEDYGVEYCASESRLNRDTINDIVTGRVERPRKKTREKLENLFAILRQLQSKTPGRMNRAFKKLRS